MNEGIEEYDQQILEILEKKYHLFFDSPNGEIQMFLILPKNNEDKITTTINNTFNIPSSKINFIGNPKEQSILQKKKDCKLRISFENVNNCMNQG